MGPLSLEGFAQRQVLYLTTVGRVTGLPREIEIWFVVFEDKFYLFAEHFDAGWVKNIKRNPSVWVRIAGAGWPRWLGCSTANGTVNYGASSRG